MNGSVENGAGAHDQHLHKEALAMHRNFYDSYVSEEGPITLNGDNAYVFFLLIFYFLFYFLVYIFSCLLAHCCFTPLLPDVPRS